MQHILLLGLNNVQNPDTPLLSPSRRLYEPEASTPAFHMQNGRYGPPLQLSLRGEIPPLVSKERDLDHWRLGFGYCLLFVYWRLDIFQLRTDLQQYIPNDTNILFVGHKPSSNSHHRSFQIPAPCLCHAVRNHNRDRSRDRNSDPQKCRDVPASS